MNIAVYSLTRERKAYVEISFASLKEKAGYPYKHWVFENGSQDGTHEWVILNCEPSRTFMAATNQGISIASNICVKAILAMDNPDLVIKMDSDCQVITPNILASFARIYEDPEAQRWVLAPRVQGIVNQPRRVRTHQLAGHEIGVTAIVGGIFHVVPTKIYREFMQDGGYDEGLPLAALQDDQFCEWLRAHGYQKGYVEDLECAHIDGTAGQAAKYPEYFQRKWREEKERPVKA